MDTFALTTETATAEQYPQRHRFGSANQAWKGGKVAIACAECGTEVLRFPSQVKSTVFCSEACNDKHGLVSMTCAWPGCTTEMPARKFEQTKAGGYFVYKTVLTKRGYYSRQPICAHHLARLTDNYGAAVRLNSFWKITRGDNPRIGRGISRMVSFVVWERQDGKCASCENTFQFNARRPRAKSDCWDGTWECDHVVPVFDGGKTTLGNLQALCHECHTEKSRAEKSRATLSRHTRTAGAFRSTNYEKNERIEELCREVASLKQAVFLLVMLSSGEGRMRS